MELPDGAGAVSPEALQNHPADRLSDKTAEQKPEHHRFVDVRRFEGRLQAPIESRLQDNFGGTKRARADGREDSANSVEVGVVTRATPCGQCSNQFIEARVQVPRDLGCHEARDGLCD